MVTEKPKSKPYFTPEQYLEIDRSSEERYEYLDGEIFLMAGESSEHGDISMNLSAIFGNQLKGTDCRGRIKDTKILSGAGKKNPFTQKGLFSYPDLVVICGELKFHDEVKDIVLNPKVIVEVLSESTESFDRGDKFMRYRLWNPTLTDYILVSQNAPIVEHYIKQESGDWLLKEYHGLDKNFAIESINVRLTLTDIYDRIEFEEIE
ncbi:MAG: Uma2 family endonuclease [Acidobacteriota bacterium]|nr:Uma2 family endonuclease [Acidobacteriota bacterium]